MNDSELDHRLAQLRNALAAEEPPPRVDDAIRRAISARSSGSSTARAWHWRWSWPRAWLALPAALGAALLAVLVAHRVLLAPAAVDDQPRPGADGMAGVMRGGPFIPLVSLSELEAASDTLVVSTTMPRMQLSELGVPVDPAGAVDAVGAEFLVRADGAVLAVRLSR